MKYLLDTHSYLWWIADPERLSERAQECISDRNAQVYVSMASYWEISIKSSLGKLSLSRGVEHLESELSEDGLTLLPIRIGHCAAVGRLPFHHRDPFDRLLVAQAIVEGLALVGKDSWLDSYGLNRIW